jgi:hypothetical protein
MSSSFYTPKSYTQILQTKYSNFTLPKTVTSITNYNRYLIQVGKDNTKFLGINSASNYSCSLNVLKNTSTTYLALLGSTFQLVQNAFDASTNSLYYRITSDLHSNYSLDCTFNSENSYSSILHFTNNWGIDRTNGLSYSDTTPSTYSGDTGTTGYTGTGYIVFSYANNKFTAKARYYTNNTYYINTGTVYQPTSYQVYNAGGGGEGHVLDSNFPYVNYNLYYLNGTFLLSNSTSSYIKLYVSRINLGIPYQFNPKGVSRVANLAVSMYLKGIPSTGLTALINVNNTLTNIYGKSNIGTSPAGYNYYNQLYIYNTSNMTITNKTEADGYVETMLDTIYNNSNASSIRYPKTLYKAFRTGLLSNTMASNSILNAYLSGNTTLQVYFTNELDNSGNYAPFMIILNTSVPSGPCRLLDVNKPPGDAINHNYSSTNQTTGYTNQYVTRTAGYQTFLTKIPMLKYGLAGAITSVSGNSNNSVMSTIGSLASDANTTNYDYFNYASTSSCGIAVDSTQLYPVLNNSLVPSCIVGELSALGHHAGQGLGPHYHADSFQCNAMNLNLYNTTDYTNKKHPPLIGFGFDGIALYGSYTYGYNANTNKSNYTYSNMDGYKINLDNYGAHSHGTYGYHYHAKGISSLSIPCYASKQGSTRYSVYALMYGPWAGLVTSIPSFTSLDAPNQQTKYVGLLPAQQPPN